MKYISEILDCFKEHAQNGTPQNGNGREYKNKTLYKFWVKVLEFTVPETHSKLVLLNDINEH